MAVHNLTAMNQEAKVSAREALRRVQPTFLAATDAVVLADETTYKETAWYADGAWTARTTATDAPESEDILSGAAASEPTPFQNLLSMSFDEYERNPDMVGQYAEQIAQTWLDELDDDWWTAVLSIAAALHPFNGVNPPYAAVGGGTVYFGDEFSMTTPGGVTFTQKNLFSDTLSSTALSAAMSARHNYRRPDGRRAKRPGEKPILFCVTDIFDIATNLLGRTGEIYDGEGLQLGAFGNYIDQIVVVPGGITSSTTAWGLIWPTMFTARDRTGRRQNLKACPIMPVVRDNMRVRVTEDTNDNVINVIGHASKSIHYRPWEGDIQLHIS